MKKSTLSYLILGAIGLLIVSSFVFRNEITSILDIARYSFSSVGTATPLSVSCSRASFFVAPNSVVTYTAKPTGGTGTYTYKWKGIGVVDTGLSTLNMVYTSLGSKVVTLEVYSGDSVATGYCTSFVTNNVPAPVPVATTTEPVAPTTPTAPATPAVTVTCSSGMDTAAPGTAITYTAEARGGTGTYTYSWTGNDGLTDSGLRWSGKTYTTTGTKTATVTVKSGTQSATGSCGVTIIQPATPAYAPLVAKCGANYTSVPTGTIVTYTAWGQGGNGLYSYSWTGSDNMPSENLRWQGMKYSTAGSKTARVAITSAGQTSYGYCGVTVTAPVVVEPIAEVVVPFVPTAPIKYPATGVNLEELTDYAVSSMFADAMKSARSFSKDIYSPWSYTNSVALDANGWPLADFGVLVFTDAKDAEGTYKLKFNGRADVKPVGTNVTVTNNWHDDVNNISYADVNVTGAQLVLSFTNTSGGVKNISLMRPGHTSSDVFNKKFLAAISHAQVLRGMDYLNTNGNPVRNWLERTKPTDALQSGKMPLIDPATGKPPVDVDGKLIAECQWYESPVGSGKWYQNSSQCTPWNLNKGAAVEFLIQLANKTGKDLWINIPSEATDDYVTQLAKLLKSSLNSSSKLYVEYSNEIWNGAFLQQSLVRRSAQKDAALDQSLTDYGAMTTDNYYVHFRQVARKSMMISNIFKDVFGSSAINDRVRVILPTQFANLDLAHEGLNYIQKYYGKPSNYFYGLAGAPYYTPGSANDVSGASVDSIIDGLTSHINKFHKSFIAFNTLANSHGLKAIAYEGGSDTTGGAANTNKYTSANDPRMKEVTMKFLSQWYGCGGDLFVYYNLAGINSRHGTWGLTDNINKIMPKLDGFNSIATTPLNHFQCNFADEGTSSRSLVKVTNPGQGNGLTGTYFKDTTLTSSLFSRHDQALSFDWSGTMPYSGLPNTFSSSWTGFIKAPGTGTYTITARTGGADGIRLTIGTTKVIDSWPTPSPSTDGGIKERTGTMTFTAGTSYPIKVEYYHQATYFNNNPVLQLLWSGSGQPKAIISGAQLYH